MGRLLKEKQGASAMVRFERALMLAKALSDKCQERRATRGLAAAARLQVRLCRQAGPRSACLMAPGRLWVSQTKIARRGLGPVDKPRLSDGVDAATLDLGLVVHARVPTTTLWGPSLAEVHWPSLACKGVAISTRVACGTVPAWRSLAFL